jgi:DNA-binding GntR family transcriptional regulator
MGNMSPNAENLAYSRIRTAIFKRHIRQGSKLVEASLAKQLDISRTPVRGALKRLSYEGLVEFSTNRGAQVIKPTEEEIRQTFAVRAQLEKMAASLAAQNASEADVAELKRLTGIEERVFKEQDTPKGPTQYYEINNTIHLLIAKMAGNEVLYSHIENLLLKTTIYLILFDPYDQMAFNPSPIEHQEIVTYLARGDGPKAEAAMVKHLMTSLDGMDFENALPSDYLAV